ncbi:phosphoenolpyruvate--protein phosphotransferase [Neptuniibacter sp. CAU 1671]|uniref:phosphoenolpyruvate--protein phosphotransferase n=1 Tax=Neptuniibacter sp. CAU 1671 TaxID=3032593 RepID=UPI0023DB49DC|nr:phosphoenolpyruvate--protein phosphotransferase [Neptuniibacter sp. CAU 1671]MDF2182657.1 phosphoenolpyruvate--protein phosphotransferase [Neptuniibacter sp. CAU 1671]
MLEVLRKIVQEVSLAPDLKSVVDMLVQSIRQAMQTQVCSVYLFDAEDHSYVLMASEGLNKEAIGSVRLSAGEGLVGLVVQRAEPINLEKADEHPAFKYLESTGEERFSSFLGVPIIHHRDVLGVLVVQQKEQRRFDESEEAFLVTLSAQLAGAIAHAEATGSLGSIGGPEKPQIELHFEGVAGSSGVAIGQGVVIAPPADLNSVPDKPAGDIDREIESFYAALEQVRNDVREVSLSLAKRLRSQEQALFDVYLRMLEDNALAGEVVERIRKGLWAQGALREVVLEHVRKFSMMDDAYLRERATDIRDLGRRVLAYLQEANTRPTEFTDTTILVADELTPAMLGEVPSDKLVGLVSVHGSSNSHAAILARSLGIPTIMGVVDLPYTKMDGRELVLDGYSGRVYVQPGPELRKAYEDILRDEREQAAELQTLKNLPAKTLDGHHVPLWVNTGLLADLSRSLERGAEGIGLYRTEIPFMTREFFPSEQEQRQTYHSQLKAFSPRPVTMRTLDIGGDKALSYFPIEEDNPFLGWRGIRVTLDHPEIFMVQVRAMLRANEGLDNLRIMLPMVTSMHEIQEASRQIGRAVLELQEEGCNIERPEVGVMVEVPAAVYQVRQIARLVDFISVGSNDLAQYLLAVDRNNPRVSDLYNGYHPAVLQALRFVVREAHKEGVPVSICGELAGEPGGALLLMAMGYDSLSMNATNLPKVKAAIRKINLTDAQALLKEVMSMDDAEVIQQLIARRMAELGVSQRYLPFIPG